MDTYANLDIRDTVSAQRYINTALEAQNNGDRLGAIEAYEAAYAADPDNPETCFRLAYNLDLVGEEDEALHLYEQACQCERPALNALMNLAVLYEDRGQYAQAERCILQVLATEPNHERALLYLKDVQASNHMKIDEDEDRNLEKQRALFDTPVTDFDLSVRARNALRKMNIRTLGDLLRVTEAELRSYKNFGEASLEEIKTMLAQRGLRLGESREQAQNQMKQQMYNDIAGAAEGDDEGDETMQQSVAELNLSVRARKALALLNINYIGDLITKTEAELMGVKNFGMTSLLEINEKLAERGLSLRQLDA
jgi:DNA-directed RNA polymerase subunit alpha